MLNSGPDTELQLEHYYAITDPLTGLLNRRGLEEKFNDFAGRLPGRFGIIGVDLDDLKAVNDAGGQLAGDEYLVDAAKILESSVRTTDRDEPDVLTAARLGGDEFVLLVNIKDENELKKAAERLRLELENAGIAASMGSRTHKAGENLAEIINEADLELRVDKKQRKTEKFNSLARRKRIAAQIGLRLLRYAGMKPPR